MIDSMVKSQDLLIFSDCLTVTTMDSEVVDEVSSDVLCTVCSHIFFHHSLFEGCTLFYSLAVLD